MKQVIITILTFLILVSCSKNKFEKRLIGTWNNYPTNGSSDLRLYKDSVVSYEFHRKKTGTWKANSSQIILHLPQKSIGYSESYTLDYKLHNDSLFIKNVSDSIFRIPVHLKVTNDWEHYLKEIGLEIELPDANFELMMKDSIWFGIDLYLAYKNDSLMIKNDEGNILTIDEDFKKYVFIERASRKEEEIQMMNFNLIIDKSVSEKEVDSIKSILKEFPEMKIFRVYKNGASDYGNYDFIHRDEKWNWYGKFE